MPYMDLVREYSRKKRFKYDHKAVFGQVRAAMAKKIDEPVKSAIEKNIG